MWAAVAAVLAGCRPAVGPESDGATASASVTAPGRPTGTVLRRASSSRKPETVTGVVWPSTGATIKLPAAGLTLRFQAGAVAQPLTVTLTAHPGDQVSYDFQPHGVRFLKPVLVQQDLKGTKAENDLRMMSDLKAGYLANGTADIDAQGRATMTEVYATQLYSEGGPKVRQLRFTLTHFSGYILASGVGACALLPVLPIDLSKLP